MSYEVYGAVRSRAFRVLWMLEELGQPYLHHAAAPRSDAVRALNPSGKIPVLVADGHVLTDSVAIMTWLADRHGQLIAPAGTLERARQEAITLSILDALEGPLWMAWKHLYVYPEDRRVPAVLDSLKWDFETAQGPIFARLDGAACFGGDEIAVPDFLAGHVGNWADRAGFPVTDPAFRAHLERMRSRPAFARVAAM